MCRSSSVCHAATLCVCVSAVLVSAGKVMRCIQCSVVSCCHQHYVICLPAPSRLYFRSGLSVCLSVCVQNISESYERVLMSAPTFLTVIVQQKMSDVATPATIICISWTYSFTCLARVQIRQRQPSGPTVAGMTSVTVVTRWRNG